MKKKVLFMMDSLTCGGAEKSLVSLLPLLDYDKLDVTLLLQKRGGIFECYVPKEVKIEEMRTPSSLFMKFCSILYSIKYRLYSIIGKNEHTAETLWRCVSNAYKTLDGCYDYAIAYQQGFPTYFIASKVNAKQKIAWVNVDLNKAGYNVAYNQLMYDKYQRVIAVSDAVNHDLISQNYVNDASKVQTIYDILNPTLIRNMAKEQGFKDDYKGIRIVTVGRLTPQKSYDLAVMTAYELRKRGIVFKWSFVGEGASRAQIEDMIQKYELNDVVELLGEKANPYPYMAACDVYVQTSKFEGFGLTVTEARILGKAEVCTNFPCAYNQITDGVNGLISEMTPEAVADKIERLLTDKDLKTKLEANVANEVNRTAETESAKVFSLLDL